MLAITSLFHTDLATTLFHELFNSIEALAFKMTYSLADVTAFEWNSTCLTAIWAIFMAVNLVCSLLSTCAWL